MDLRPIGVFDSGSGGLTAVREIRSILPSENIIYFGDTSRVPYGSRSAEILLRYARQDVRFLRTFDIKALVVACNTATSAAIHDLREAYPDTIVIGIEPALKLAYDRYHGGGIGVMATPMTLREEKFEALMHRYDQSCRVYKIPAPGLVEPALRHSSTRAGSSTAPRTVRYFSTIAAAASAKSTVPSTR